MLDGENSQNQLMENSLSCGLRVGLVKAVMHILKCTAISV